MPGPRWNTFFSRFPGITAQQAADLFAAMPGLSGPQCADLVTGLPGLNSSRSSSSCRHFLGGGMGQFARLITRLAPLTGQQIIALVQSLMQQRVFTLLHIYSIVEILSTNNGVQIQNFFTLYSLVNGQPMANVVRELHFGAQPSNRRADLRCSERGRTTSEGLPAASPFTVCS